MYHTLLGQMRRNFHSHPEIRGISFIQVLYLCAFFFTDCRKCLQQILSSNPNKSIVTSRLHEPLRHFDVRAVQSFSMFFFHSLAVLFYHYIYKSIVFYQKCILDLNQMKIRKSGYQYRENGEQYSKKLGSIRFFLNKVIFLNFKRHDGRIILILTTLRGLHG